MSEQEPKIEPVAKPKGITWSEIKAIVLIIALAVFFGLPLAAGHCVIPTSINPGELGAFCGGLLRYWFEFLGALIWRLIGG